VIFSEWGSVSLHNFGNDKIFGHLISKLEISEYYKTKYKTTRLLGE
jgi:hypothetical protein